MNKRMFVGYTLIEILIVLAVVGILVSMSALGYRNYIKTIQLNESIQTVTGLIKGTQESSLTKSMVYQIDYVALSKKLTVKDSANNLIKEVVLPYGEITTWTAAIRFLSRGLPQQQYQFVIKNDLKSRNVFVLTTGKVIVR